MGHRLSNRDGNGKIDTAEREKFVRGVVHRSQTCGPAGMLVPTWKNTIGDSELITARRDPDFDPRQRAFYYARVIEIPTPRWTAYDARRTA